MTDEETWADRLGARGFEMLTSPLGSLGWALAGAVVGAVLGAFPTGLPFLTWFVACAALGFLAWYGVGLGLGLVAMAGWAAELVAAAARWVRKTR